MSDEIREHVENRTELMPVVELMNSSSSLFEINKHVVIIFCNGCVPSLFRVFLGDSLYTSTAFLIIVAHVAW